MILTKLQEALAEVEVQRAAINDVEAQLRDMIAKLSGTPICTPTPIAISMPARAASGKLGEKRDNIDAIADILRAEGRPMHITVIAERLSSSGGTTVKRTKIEPGLNRHIAKVKERRIEKFGPSTYGLPEWKQFPLREQTVSVA